MEAVQTNGHAPAKAEVADDIRMLEATEDDAELVARAAQFAGALAFVHFDPNAAKSNMVEALIHHEDLVRCHRGQYVHIESIKDGRRYTGRVVEGPFYNPDALKRDSTPIQFIILNQGQGKALSVPEYHGWFQVEILGEERSGVLVGAVRRPHPASPIFPYDASMMTEMFHLRGNIRMGLLDNYEDVFVEIDGNDKGVVPRNWLTVGTIGGGKSNTSQVFVEETVAAGYAQVVVDPEGEYIFMDQPSDAPGIQDEMARYERQPKGVQHLTVYKPPRAESKREDAVEFSVPFDSLSPEVICEIAEMNTAQETRFTFLYEQAIQLLLKETGTTRILEGEDLDISRGYPGIKLDRLVGMLDDELAYHEWKRTNKPAKAAKARGSPGRSQRQSEDEGEEIEASEEASTAEMKIYCHIHGLRPLVADYQDAASFGALRKMLRRLKMTGIFDREDAPKLKMSDLSRPGHLSVIDMSDSRDQLVVNIVIADLLARTYLYKMKLNETQNAERKVVLTLEEAHGFVSREKQDRMEQTLDQLRRIARRGRKRWLALHFVTQSPQHLPSELFELANNKIIHQTTGTDNLRVLKAAAGTVNEGIWQDVPSLGRGRAILVCSQYPHPIMVQVRPAASRRNYMT
jgi:hypothetical protein